MSDEKDKTDDEPMFGDDQPAPMGAAGMFFFPTMAAAYACCPFDEQTEFDVELTSLCSVPATQVVKELRKIMDGSMQDIFNLVRSAPVIIATGVSKYEAEDTQKRLEAIGCKVLVK